MSTRAVVFGLDCQLYYLDPAQRADLVTNFAASNAFDTAQYSNGDEWCAIKTVREVTLNLTSSTADVTTRNANGWRQMVPTLKEASIDFQVLWQPDQAVFDDLLTYYISQCPMAFLILDGKLTESTAGYITAWIAQTGRCSETGYVITGLFADCAITNFSRNEALEEAVVADVTIQPTVGVGIPQWVSSSNASAHYWTS